GRHALVFLRRAPKRSQSSPVSWKQRSSLNVNRSFSGCEICRRYVPLDRRTARGQPTRRSLQSLESTRRESQTRSDDSWRKPLRRSVRCVYTTAESDKALASIRLDPTDETPAGQPER